MGKQNCCRKCNEPITLTDAQRRHCNYVCNGCANRQRDADPARYLARKTADRLRRKGVCKPYPGVVFVRQFLARIAKKEEEEGNLRHMSLVFKDPNAGVTLENAQLVTSTECGIQSRAGTCL